MRFNLIKRLFSNSKIKLSNQFENLNLIQYYNKYIEEIEIDPKTLNYKNLDENILILLLSLYNNKNEYEFFKEKIFNLMGHKIKTNNLFFDEFIDKSLEFGIIKENLDLFENHCYLHYFPNYNVTNKLIKLFEKEDEENTLKLFKILEYYSLIKLNEESFVNLENLIEKFENKEEFNRLLDSIKINRNN